MEKYYIYLNEKRYMELPKAFNIKKDVYIWSNDGIDGILDKALGGIPMCGTTRKYRGKEASHMWIQTKLMFPERYGAYGKYSIPIPPESKKYLIERRNKTIKHELRHIEQFGQSEWLGNYDIKQLKPIMEELTSEQRYTFFNKRKGYWENPYEVEAREWGGKNIRLQREALEKVKQSIIKPQLK